MIVMAVVDGRRRQEDGVRAPCALKLVVDVRGPVERCCRAAVEASYARSWWLEVSVWSIVRRVAAAVGPAWKMELRSAGACGWWAGQSTTLATGDAPSISLFRHAICDRCRLSKPWPRNAQSSIHQDISRKHETGSQTTIETFV